MAWIESHQELGQHPKLKKLCRVLNISQPAAVGHLQYLWWWAVDYCDHGDLTRFDSLDIAIAAMWEGDPDEFVNALIQCGWIDRALDEMFIHDWEVYIGRLLDRRRKDADRKRESRRRPEDVPRTSSGHPEDGAQTAHVTVPNQTVPSNQTPTTTEGEEQTAAAPPRARGSRIDVDWQPSDIDIAFARNEGMSERDIQREAQKFRDHWCATPGAKGTKLDWPATWRNWIRREMSDPRRLRVVNGTNGHQPKRLTDEEVASGLYDTY